MSPCGGDAKFTAGRADGSPRGAGGRTPAVAPGSCPCSGWVAGNLAGLMAPVLGVALPARAAPALGTRELGSQSPALSPLGSRSSRSALPVTGFLGAEEIP